MGHNVDPITNRFWDIESSGQTTLAGGTGQTTLAGGTGKTTEEKKTFLTFCDAGLGFSNFWNINPELNNGYPYLYNSNCITNNDIIIILPSDLKALLKNAYPNLFNPSTTLSFELSSPEIVRIDIYNVKGQLVKSLVKGAYNTGKHSIVWEGKDNKGDPSCSGVYFYKMQAGIYSQPQQMMLMK